MSFILSPRKALQGPSCHAESLIASPGSISRVWNVNGEKENTGYSIQMTVPSSVLMSQGLRNCVDLVQSQGMLCLPSTGCNSPESNFHTKKPSVFPFKYLPEAQMEHYQTPSAALCHTDLHPILDLRSCLDMGWQSSSITFLWSWVWFLFPLPGPWGVNVWNWWILWGWDPGGNFLGH